MSVVINSNFAATLAANNLAASNGLLQRSLNRLSSGSRIVNPADDAGGLAVSMKLSATARRQGASTTNLGNSVSYLQSQDGVLRTAGKVLERISELKTLALDPTKNAADLANYNSEFVALQTELGSLGTETFNGIDLFGSASLSVGATADVGGSAIAFGGTDLFGVGVAGWNNVGMSGADWISSNAEISQAAATASKGIVQAGDNTIAFHNSAAGTYQTTQSNITGPFSLSFDTSSSTPDIYQQLNITAGGASLNLTALLGDADDHHVEIVDDGVNASISIDGGAATVMGTLTTPGGGALVLSTAGNGGDFFTGGDFHIANLTLNNTGGGSRYNDVANAASLAAVDLADISSAIQELATFRADNGAQQSRLGYAMEVLATNKANLEAANSRIVDVDVASESTQLARYNILVQAGTAMLSQANQSAQSALRLIG
jgi:flagellin